MATKIEKKTKPKATKKVIVKKIKETSEDFAVIEVTGNQYLVYVGKEYSVKNMNLEKGKKFNCDKVLLLSENGTVKVGKPYLNDVTVECEISGNKKDKKVESFRYTAKSRYRKKTASRALITKILIKKFVTSKK